MKVLMGMIQAIFGIIVIGFIGLVTAISIGAIITKDALNWFRNLNNDTSEGIKEYYRGLEKRDNE